MVSGEKGFADRQKPCSKPVDDRRARNKLGEGIWLGEDFMHERARMESQGRERRLVGNSENVRASTRLEIWR